jgi:hypothetical protein
MCFPVQELRLAAYRGDQLTGCLMFRVGANQGRGFACCNGCVMAPRLVETRDWDDTMSSSQTTTLGAKSE